MLLPENAVRVESTPNGRRYIHLCISCGKELRNPSSHLKLRTGLCNPCFKRSGVRPTRNLLTLIRSSARGRAQVRITEAELEPLLELGCCHYCGGPIEWRRGRINLDRKDPTGDYDASNLVVCCFACNRVKTNVLSYDEMRVAMEAVRSLRQMTPPQRADLFSYGALA